MLREKIFPIVLLSLVSLLVIGLWKSHWFDSLQRKREAEFMGSPHGEGAVGSSLESERDASDSVRNSRVARHESPTGRDPSPGEEQSSVRGGLDRQNVYREIARGGDLERARSLANALERALGSATLAAVESDFFTAIESEEQQVLIGTTWVLAELAAQPQSSVDDARLESWLDWILISPDAARAVLQILKHSARTERCHLERVVELIRDGLPTNDQLELARAICSLYLLLHRDPDRFLEWLSDSHQEVRRCAIEALLSFDPLEHLEEIMIALDHESPEYKNRLGGGLIAALLEVSSPDQVSQWLIRLYDRWPEARLQHAWTAVGKRDPTVLINTFRQSKRGDVRRQVLIGFPSDFGDSSVHTSTTRHQTVEFLTEVADLESDSSLRAQAFLTLGRIEDPRAWERIGEEIARSPDRDRVLDAHLASAVWNSLSRASTTWVVQVAMPFIEVRIRNASDRRREIDHWQDRLVGRFPEFAEQLEEMR